MVDKLAEIGKFEYQPLPLPPRPTVLGDNHTRRTKHMSPFAGYMMPLWFSSISDEHRAVRETAGLFDCTHMGVLEFTGTTAREFLDAITMNDVAHLADGQAQYSFIADAAGGLLDDLIIYRRDADHFMMVCNAANEPKIKAYLQAIIKGEAILDVEQPQRKMERIPTIIDLRDPVLLDARVDIAVQGPATLELLKGLLPDDSARQRLASLPSFHFFQTSVGGIDTLIAYTGYTGSRTGFELFAHPNRAPDLWEMLLEKGGPLGVKPCGLGARDSLRIEAGLPLFGHELDGEWDISPFQAGYGWAVKLNKSFFVGQRAMVKKSTGFDMHLVRMELPGGRGVRPVRAHDGVVTPHGKCVGWISSAAGVAGDKQVALALVEKESLGPEDPVGVYLCARSQAQIDQGKKTGVRRGEGLLPEITGKVTKRFVKF